MVDVGPFSTVRNPLYLFSLCGATGIAFASGSITMLVLLMGFF